MLIPKNNFPFIKAVEIRGPLGHHESSCFFWWGGVSVCYGDTGKLTSLGANGPASRLLWAILDLQRTRPTCCSPPSCFSISCRRGLGPPRPGPRDGRAVTTKTSAAGRLLLLSLRLGFHLHLVFHCDWIRSDGNVNAMMQTSTNLLTHAHPQKKRETFLILSLLILLTASESALRRAGGIDAGSDLQKRAPVITCSRKKFAP